MSFSKPNYSQFLASNVYEHQVVELPFSKQRGEEREREAHVQRQAVDGGLTALQKQRFKWTAVHSRYG